MDKINGQVLLDNVIRDIKVFGHLHNVDVSTLIKEVTDDINIYENTRMIQAQETKANIEERVKKILKDLDE